MRLFNFRFSGLMMCRCLSLALLASVFCGRVVVAETFSPLTEGRAPQTFEELWLDYDPRAESLDSEILYEGEDDGIILKVVRYRVGVFKGQKAMMASVYGYPKEAGHVPGLVQIHGGGQFANYREVTRMARLGYAVISIAWSGRIYLPGYMVNRDVVQLFWDGETNNPNYKITTDWGAIDGYHAPCRYEGNNFVLNPPGKHSLDPVPSARNSGWFLVAIGAGRALTFLEQQPEVDGDRLGVFGFSMGGKLAVMLAATDDRVKAAGPAAGGVSDRYNGMPNYKGLISDDVYLERITCPIAFLSPANDFHSRINDLPAAVEELQTDQWRVTCAPNLNHHNPPPHEALWPLWLNQHLKGAFTVPATPKTELVLETPSGVPSITIDADTSRSIERVDVYYTEQGQVKESRSVIDQAISRYWRHVPAMEQGGVWKADLPVLNVSRPLWVYANVTYSLEEPVDGVTTFVLSSLVNLIAPEQLSAAGVQATLAPTRIIETFEKGWSNEWFKLNHLGLESTHKIYDDQYKAPPGASLAFEVLSSVSNRLVVGLGDSGAVVSLAGGPEWQACILHPSDFTYTDGSVRSDWQDLQYLQFSHKLTVRKRGAHSSVQLGQNWAGPKPEVRNLRWTVPTPASADKPNQRNNVADVHDEYHGP